MEPYFQSSYFAQLMTQLNTMIQQGQTNYVNNIAVLNVECEG